MCSYAWGPQNSFHTYVQFAYNSGRSNQKLKSDLQNKEIAVSYKGRKGHSSEVQMTKPFSHKGAYIQILLEGNHQITLCE